MRITLLIIISFITFQSVAQVTVNRKTAQRWDSYSNNAWQGEDSVIYLYDAYGQETFRFATKRNASNAWINNFRYLKNYDAQQNLTEVTQENWDGGAWVSVSKYIYSYNANNQQTDAIYQTWYSSQNAWRNTGRFVNTYNVNQNLTKLEIFTWDGSGWLPLSRQDFTYNAGQDLTKREFYKYTNNNWIKEERREYQYAFGYVSSNIKSVEFNGNWLLKTRELTSINGSVTPPRIVASYQQSRDTANSNWIDSSRALYTYNSNLLSNIEVANYDTNSNIWISKKLTSYIHNANNLVSEEKIQLYNTANSMFENHERKTLTYHPNNLVDLVTYYENQGTTNWKANERDQHTYNSNDSLTYRLNESFINNSYLPNAQYFYYYDNIAVGLSDYNNLFSKAQLYPNPSSSFIAIKTSEKIKGAHQAIVFSMEGKMVWSQLNTQAVEEMKYDISGISNGNYILQIIELNSGKTQHFKFNKQ